MPNDDEEELLPLEEAPAEVPEPPEREEATNSFFVEADEVVALISCLSDEGGKHEAAADRIAKVLDQYQEQPSILDPQLEAMVVPLLESVRLVARGGGSAAVLPHACRIFYTLCKVRGFKTIVKFVPHEVADLEPLVHLLAKYDVTDHDAWQIAYALMVWLSMVVMVPFDLSIIDSSLDHTATGAGAADGTAAGGGGSKGSPLVKSIERLALSYLGSTGPARDAAAILLARLLTRPGLQLQLSEFVVWGGRELEKARSDGGAAEGGMKATFLMVGIYTALAQIFKLGHRAELLPQLPLLGSLTSSPEALLSDPSVTRRKLGMKLLQRVAAVHLPPRVASWRYQRGARSLEQNLQLTSGGGGGGGDDAQAAPEPEKEEEEEEEDVPEEIEEILDQLLKGLRDHDTVVRWSAAKGIGRVTARLALEMADDIVESVLELLTSEEDANAWHGGCMALAELSRRGLLLPARLAQVLPRVVTALHYDVPRGATSVGTHVRDAACYVCWAFARAFEPSVMAPHVGELARALLIVVVFDREVNCRRAASAAFQENVGRQGNFPHGIDIVTRADYFTVGSRPFAYLEIGEYLGGFDAYRRSMLEHLSTVKYKHWDNTIRLLASQAVSRLAPLDEPYVLETLIPFLVGKTLSQDLKARHGATHMLAETLFGLVTGKHGGDGKQLPAETRKAVAGVVPAIEKARLYRGRGGEIMRGATARLLEVLAALRMPCGPKMALKNLATLDDALKHPTEPISLAGVAALKQAGLAYFAEGAGAAEPLVKRYVAPLRTDPNAALRRGYTLALGALPSAQLEAALPSAVETLIAASVMEDDPEARDPETRRNAVRALHHVSATVTLSAFDPPPPSAPAPPPAPAAKPAAKPPAKPPAGAPPGAAEGGAAAGGAPPAAVKSPDENAPPAVSKAPSTAGAAAPSPSPEAEAVPDVAGAARQLHGMRTALYVSAVEAMLSAMGDYQTDNRGDVGSWVREAAIGSLLPMLCLAAPPSEEATAQSRATAAARGRPSGEKEEAAAGGDVAEACAARRAEAAEERAALEAALPRLCARFVELLTQQANEKIDRLREHACLTLSDTLRAKGLPAVPDRDLLASVLLAGETRKEGEAAAAAAATVAAAATAAVSSAEEGGAFIPTSDYLAPHTCFPRTVRFLGCGAYRRSVLHGVCISAGGITESTTKAACSCLLGHIRTLDLEGKAALADDLVSLLVEHEKVPRVCLPLMRTLQHLLESQTLEPVLDRTQADEAGGLASRLVACVRPASRSKDVPTLIVALALLLLLLPHAVGVCRTEVLRHIILLLGHRFPKVRKAAADQLYVHLITFGDLGELTPIPEAEGEDDSAAPRIVEVGGDDGAPEVMPAGDERHEFVMSVLMETAWLDDLETHAKPARSRLIAALGLPPPRVTAGVVREEKKKEDFEQYMELVAEAGY